MRGGAGHGIGLPLQYVGAMGTVPPPTWGDRYVTSQQPRVENA